MENKLPNNWVKVNLKEVVSYKKGKKPKILKDEFFEDSVPYLDIMAFEKGVVRRYADVESSNLIEDKSIGIVWDGARSGWVSMGQNGAVGSTIAILKPFAIEPVYLYRFLQSNFNFLNTNTRGTGIPHVDPQILWNIKFPLAPLKEQQRITKKLDSLFSQLDDVKLRLEKIPELLKNFRQAILNEAYQTNFDRVTLDDVCLKIQDGAHHSPKKQYAENDGSKFLYITSKNIRNNYMNLSKIVYVDKEFHDSIYSRCKPEFGDVLLTKDGANTGNVTLNTLKEPFSLLSSVCLIKTNKEKLIPSYLKYFIQSPIGFKELIGEMSGTAIKRIVLRKIKKATIPLPLIEEQNKIIKRIEDSFSKVDLIETQYEALKEKMVTLPQSILHKAFKGELVEQLPTDGDAKELLKQINKLKEEINKKGKKKK
ncbi:MAG: restriction endonuclease subunit S [Chitinophagales bacterium]